MHISLLLLVLLQGIAALRPIPSLTPKLVLVFVLKAVTDLNTDADPLISTPTATLNLALILMLLRVLTLK